MLHNVCSIYSVENLLSMMKLDTTLSKNALPPKQYVCLETYYGSARTRDISLLTTKTSIVKSLKHDIFSGKTLNKAMCRIILDEDPEESGVFQVVVCERCIEWARAMSPPEAFEDMFPSCSVYRTFVGCIWNCSVRAL